MHIYSILYLILIFLHFTFTLHSYMQGDTIKAEIMVSGNKLVIFKVIFLEASCNYNMLFFFKLTVAA